MPTRVLRAYDNKLQGFNRAKTALLFTAVLFFALLFACYHLYWTTAAAAEESARPMCCNTPAGPSFFTGRAIALWSTSFSYSAQIATKKKMAKEAKNAITRTITVVRVTRLPSVVLRFGTALSPFLLRLFS